MTTYTQRETEKTETKSKTKTQTHNKTKTKSTIMDDYKKYGAVPTAIVLGPWVAPNSPLWALPGSALASSPVAKPNPVAKPVKNTNNRTASKPATPNDDNMTDSQSGEGGARASDGENEDESDDSEVTRIRKQLNEAKAAKAKKKQDLQSPDTAKLAAKYKMERDEWKAKCAKLETKCENLKNTLKKTLVLVRDMYKEGEKTYHMGKRNKWADTSDIADKN